VMISVSRVEIPHSFEMKLLAISHSKPQKQRMGLKI